MKVIIGSLIAFFVVFIFSILGTLGGAITGWIVGLVFSDSILGVLTSLHIYNVTMWQLGAFLGFTGAFFRSVVTTKSGD